MTRNKRILLVAQPLRLSNAARLATLGRALHAAGYTVVLAADPRFGELVGDLPFRVIPLRSGLTRDEVKARWRAMMPMFDPATLERYVREDIRLMRTVMPDLVIGDMRPTLPISARRQGVRFAVIVDATFSPECKLPFELPQLPLTDFIGRGPAQGLFDVLVPLGMFIHALPTNLTRLNHGIGGWHQDVRQSYTDADLVIYPNIPEIIPMKQLPATHRFIGPVLWSSESSLPAPAWWDTLPADRPIIWADLSVADAGSPAVAILEGLVGVGATVIVSAAPDNPILTDRKEIFAAEHLRRTQLAQRASIVLTTADTTAIQQSLAAGTPVLVVPEPEESVAYANAVRARGAAEVLRGDSASPEALRHTVFRMLAEPAYRKAAHEIARLMAKYDSSKLMVDFVDDALEASAAAAAA